MRVVLLCEESQTVCKSFRAKGHEAYSCDTEPCSGGHPEWHIQDDAIEVAKGGVFPLGNSDFIKDEIIIYKWDRIISFQPCTHLAVSGAKHFEIKRNDGRQEAGIRFFFEIWKVSDVCENPIGILNGGEYIKKWFPILHAEMLEAGFPFKASQIIQPWQFGDKAQKSTCLWIKKLPLLHPTDIVDKGEFYITPTGKKMASWMCDPVGTNGKKLSYSGSEIKKVRSKTFQGIANAMANTWG